MQPFSNNDYGGNEYGNYDQQQQSIPMRPTGAARPMVDPEAAGEVDPSL